MKRTNPFAIVAALVIALIPITGTCCYADDDPLTIVIGDANTNGGPIFHAPALIPIQAAYYPTLTTVMVNFLYDLGAVPVEIENLTAGAYSQTTINATQGVHPFVISGDGGVYKITFTLSNGHIYTGTFEIE